VVTGQDLIGRDRPRRALTSAVDAAAAGAGGLVLVTGEAGIGKTALVTAAMAHAREAGALVASGTCWDGDGVPGLWPWIHIVRALRRGVEPDVWERAARDAGAGLERLLGGASTPSPSASASAFEIIDAVTTLVDVLAHERPVVLVVEDLHWADAASVRVLGALVGRARLGRLLLIGTYRHDEADLGELAARATTVHLVGLDRTASAALLAAAGIDAADIVDEVHRRAGGNPFFLQQLGQLWATSSTMGPVPPGVGAVIERRLARLRSPVADVLGAASVLGVRFATGLLAPVLGAAPQTVGDLLAEAQAAGLVASDGAEWRFVHDLVRETLQSATPAAERRRVHAAAARALHARAVGQGALAITAAADHAALGVPDLPAAEAVDLLIAAAADASRRLMADEAARHLARALALLEAGDRRTDEITLDLATEQRRGGHLDPSRATYTTLLDRSDAVTYAAAALGLHRLGTYIHDDAGRHGLLDEARRRLVAADDLDPGRRQSLLAQVLGALVRNHVHQTELERPDIDQLSNEAVRLARQSGDSSTLSFALLARHDAIWEPGSAAERLQLTAEMAAAARAATDPEMELQALELEFAARMELADPAAFGSVDRYVELEARLGLPRCRYRALSRRTTVATIRGRFAEALQLIDEAYALGERVGEIDREGVRCDQSWEIACQQGDLAAGQRIVERFAGDPHIAVIEIDLHRRRGDVDSVRALDRRFAELGVVWPRWARTMWWTMDVELAILLGDADRCRAGRERLRPLSGRCAVLGGGVIVRGPLDLWIAKADLFLGEVEAAVRGFEAARRSAEALGARPWIVHAQVGLGHALAEHGDARAAAEAHAAAAAAAAELGMAGVLAELGTPTPAAGRTGRFVRDRDVWTLAFDGLVVRVPDAKGLRDVHTLISQRGRDVAAVELLDPGGAVHRTGSDPVLDEHARAAYRRRLTDIDDAIAAALDRGDDNRAQRLDTERDALLAELQAATGLGGRRRRLGDDAERARKAVTGRIRDTLRRLEERHPTLTAHLDASIVTGGMCRYAPTDAIEWEL
jgi:hypothetical protein